MLSLRTSHILLYKEEIFLFSKETTSSWLTKLLTQWVLETLSLRVKQLEYEEVGSALSILQ
jgi:hypothetical protein